MPGASSNWLTVRGQPIAEKGSLDHYLYEVPEEDNPHPVVGKFARGEEVDAAALYAATFEATQQVGHSESSLIALQKVRDRLREAFPELV